MCLRYSSSVVAPMQWRSPRASAGFSRLEASIAPSVAPAPTTVWSSSMKRITRPSAFWTAPSTAFSRSSNSPRNLAPATSAPMSSATTFRSRSPSGTSPFTMRTASPSAIAVLPTPGSPISTGLFLVRRERICMVRRISSSRPMTGSSLSPAASPVRSRPYRSSGSRVASGFFARHPRPVAHLFHRPAQRPGTHSCLAKNPRGFRCPRHQCEQQVLDAHIFVAELSGFARRAPKHSRQFPRDGGLFLPRERGKRGEPGFERPPERLGIPFQPLDQPDSEPLSLLENGRTADAREEPPDGGRMQRVRWLAGEQSGRIRWRASCCITPYQVLCAQY